MLVEPGKLKRIRDKYQHISSQLKGPRALLHLTGAGLGAEAGVSSPVGPPRAYRAAHGV